MMTGRYRTAADSVNELGYGRANAPIFTSREEEFAH